MKRMPSLSGLKDKLKRNDSLSKKSAQNDVPQGGQSARTPKFSLNQLKYGLNKKLGTKESTDGNKLPPKVKKTVEPKTENKKEAEKQDTSSEDVDIA